MFRRRREASFRPPASSAWWPASVASGGSDLGGGQAPALPSGDPFGGWPAFPAGGPVNGSFDGSDPVAPVLGQPDPRAGWGTPAPSATGAFPPLPAPMSPPPGRPATPEPGRPATPAGPAPTGRTGQQAVVAAAPGQLSAASRTVGHLTAVPGTGQTALAPGWTPLLTHADDSQPFQAVTEDTGSANLSAGAQASNPESRKVRAARRRDARGRRAAQGQLPEPAASPESAAPGAPAPIDPLRDTAFADGATTWLDPVAPPNPMEAAALAGAFAADYLSWDEASRERRGQVLAQYLPSDVVGSAALLGWSGKGRQRAEFALPGAVHPDGDGRVVVDVRVRVTPYRAVGQPADPAPAGELEVAGVPAVAPAPTARGWKSLDSCWVRLTVPITYDRGRLVVDTWDEQLGQDAADPDADEATESADPATAEDEDADEVTR